MLHPLPVKPAFLGPVPSSSTLLSPSESALRVSSSSSSTTEAGPSRRAAPAALHGTQAGSADPTLCIICSEPPKYTCPRCALRTCSLGCSTAHKEKYSCTGVRAAEGFVPLKTYGQGEWAEDYRYLEEGRRRVAEWGKGIKGEEMDPAVVSGRGASDTRGVGRGRGRGQGQGQGGRGGGGFGGDGGRARMRKSKTHALQMELRSRGIWAEFMPDGMGRRKINQSSWNSQSGTLHLSVQLAISAELLAPHIGSPGIAGISAPRASVRAGDSVAVAPVNDLSRRSNDSSSQPGETMGEDGTAQFGEAANHNASSTTTPAIAPSSKTVLHSRVLFAHPSQPLPKLATVLQTAPSPSLSTDIDQIICALPFYPSPARPMPVPPSNSDSSAQRPSKLFFPPLGMHKPLGEALKGAAWVEFPTVHVMTKGEWQKGIDDALFGVIPFAQPRKRGIPLPSEADAAPQADSAQAPAQSNPCKRQHIESTSLSSPNGHTKVEPEGTPAAVLPGSHDATFGSLGVLDGYGSDLDEEAEEVDDAVADEGAASGEGGDDVKYDAQGNPLEDDLVVLDQQPGMLSAAQLGGLPPDLLVAMSHAIDADLA